MSSDLPDYVRTMTINVTVPPTQNYWYGRAESASKKVAKGSVAVAGVVASLTPADGMKAVLLIVSGTAQTAGDSFILETLQSSVWTEVLPQIYVIAKGHFVYAFPCWKPTQDTGDGATATVRLTCVGTGAWRGYIMYYEEAA